MILPHFVLQQLITYSISILPANKNFMLKMQSLILPENKELLRISELGNRAGRYRLLVTVKLILKPFSVN
jgi:hypothetical protein